MLKKISDVRKALNAGCYYSALTLSLTLPDICCHIENNLRSDENSNGKQYAQWIDTHLDKNLFDFSLKGFEKCTFNGEMCYLLRCKVLHCGNTDVKNKNLNIEIDDFVLRTPEDKDYYNGFTYKIQNPQNGPQIRNVKIGIDYLCKSLCDTAEKYYNNHPDKSKFKEFSF